MPPSSSRLESGVFLNLPYKQSYERLLLAYIAGLSAFGLSPRAALEVPGGRRRLDRIFELLSDCRYSIHDISFTQLDGNSPRTPRFNMPFELGLAVALEIQHRETRDHTWFVFEKTRYRLQKSLSDLDGSDPHIHGGSVVGVWRELGNAFTLEHRQPTVADMRRIYEALVQAKPAILAAAGAEDIFAARPFKELAVLARRVAET